jgi:hypothetical protein
MCDISDVNTELETVNWNDYQKDQSDNSLINKVDKAAQSSWDTVMCTSKRNVGGAIRYEREWGGKEPPKSQWSLEGYAEDKKGNQINGRISQDSTGRNKVAVEGSRGDKNKWEKPNH